MTAIELVHEILALYLVLTLAATGAAKARNWRNASLGIAAEGLVPHHLARAAVLGACVAEVSLAVLVATRFMSLAVGLVIAAMFLVFCAYRLVTGLKRGVVGCSCAGSQTVYRATVSGIVAACLASLVQVSFATVYAFTPGVRDSIIIDGLLVVALLLPLAAIAWNVAGVQDKGAVTEVDREAQSHPERHQHAANGTRPIQRA